MRQIAMILSHFLYVQVVRRIIFLYKPDEVHDATIAFAEAVGKIAPIRLLIRVWYKPKPNPMLAQKLMGLEFTSPIGLSAGFDKNAQAVSVTSQLGFGFGTVGSVTAKACKGNTKPWFYRLPKTKSLVVHAGLANHGAKRVLRRLADSFKDVNHDYLVVLSIARTNNDANMSEADSIADYSESYRRAVESAEVSMIEVNVSCPNTKAGEPFSKPSALKKLLRALEKEDSSKPVSIKLPSDLSADQMIKLVKTIEPFAFVKALTISNLAKDRGKLKLKDVLPDKIAGNLSGKPVEEFSNQLLMVIRKTFDKRFVLIGVGGVMSADDAYKKIQSGADIVECITGLIYEGPQLPTQIQYGLTKRLKKDGFNHISEAVGLALKK